MQYDGSVWIDTKLDTDGMVKGFERIKSSAGDVASTVQKVGTVIEDAFSVAGNSATVRNACNDLERLKNTFAEVGQQLEQEKQKLATLKEDYAYLSEQLDPIKNPSGAGFNMDLDTYLEYTEALKKLPPEIEKQEAVVAKLESQWMKSSQAIEQAVTKVTGTVEAELEKQAAAAERSAERKAQAAQKESAANQQAQAASMNAGTGAVSTEFDKASSAASNFGTKLNRLAAAAFVFNIIRDGLRKVVSYFGNALMANQDFANSVARLKSALQVAFQPIYEAVIPALVKLVDWLTYAVEAVGRFFAAMAGKDYNQMRKNASSLNSTMNSTGSTLQNTSNSSNNASNAIDKVGDSIKDTGQKAKEAERALAGFDEINRLIKEDVEDLSDTLDDINKNDNLDYTDGSFGSGVGSGSGNGGMTIPAPEFEDFTFPEEWAAAIEDLGMTIHDIFFEWENMTPEIITEKLLTALLMLAGGALGFAALGGVSGALIGMTIGAVLGILLSSIIFDGDGKVSGEEIAKLLIAAVTTIMAGVAGAKLASLAVAGSTGAGGALIGIFIGAALSIAIISLAFNNDGKVTADEIVKSLISCLAIIVGTIVGMKVGAGVAALGPIAAGVGAVVGFTISAALALSILKVAFNNDGKITADEIIKSLIMLLSTIGGGLIGFKAGGPVGAAIGAVVGLVISFVIVDALFEDVEEEYDELNKTVAEGSEIATNTTEEKFIDPTQKNVDKMLENCEDDVIRFTHNYGDAVAALPDETQRSFVQPTEQQSLNLSNTIMDDTETTTAFLLNTWTETQKGTEEEFLKPTKQGFSETSESIKKDMKDAGRETSNVWSRARESIQNNFIKPMIEWLDVLIKKFANIGNAQQRVASSTTGSTTTTATVSTASLASYALTPNIPHLARGAVIPPNKQFLAVLGDQRHGTNVEAPLTTIQEAVAMVMEDMIQSNLAGHEATVAVLQQILEAVLGIELDGETLSNAVNRYNRKMAIVKGV